MGCWEKFKEKMKKNLVGSLVAAVFTMHFTYLAGTIIKRKQVQQMGEGFSSLISSWETDLVFDLGVQNDEVLANPNLLQALDTKWQGELPGLVRGCYCSSSNPMFKTKKGLKARACNDKEIEASCKSIPAFPKSKLWKWTGGHRLYAVRIPGTNFFSSYQKIDYSGECSEGYKNCGDKNSRSKGYCIPESIPGCPLTDISVSSASGYSRSLLFEGLTLYFDSKPNTNPISDLMIVQDHACFFRGHYPLASGRKKYELFEGDFDNCQKDDSVVSVSEIGEKDLFDLNGIPYKEWLDYDVSNDFRYKLAFGRTLEWSQDCNIFVTSIREKYNELKEKKTSYRIYFIILMILFSLQCFVQLCFGLSLSVYCCKKMNDIDGLVVCINIYSIFRSFIFALVLPHVIFINLNIQKLKDYLNDMILMNCSNDAGNRSLRMLDHSSGNIAKTETLVTLYIVGFVIEISLVLYLKKVFPTK